MAINLTVNGVTYEFPQEGEPEGTWGANVTAWALAVSQGMLQKSGGSFTLTGEVDFGATYGLKSAYYKSRNASVASAGIVRLGNDESISWKNAAGSADLALKVNSSDELEFGGIPLIQSGLISNDDIASDAAIAYSKLNLANSIVNADIASAAAIAYSKLNLAGSIVNTDINSAAAIAWSKISKSGSNLTDIETRSHTSLTDIGTNTHSQIDSHISATAAHGVSGDVVGTTDTQVLTAKDIDADNNTISNIDYYNFKDDALKADNFFTRDGSGNAQWTETPVFKEQSSTPSTPSAGKMLLYPKDDSKFYTLNSAGEEIEVGSGAGSAGSNLYVLNPDAEINLDNVSTSWVPITLALETTSPLAGDQSFKITSQGPSGSDRGWIEWATKKIDAADIGQLLYVSAHTRLDVGSAGAFEIGVVAGRGGLGIVDIPETFQDIPEGIFHYECLFTCPSDVDTSSYALFPIVRDKAATSGDTVVVDRLSIGPEQVVVGSAQYSEDISSDVTLNNATGHAGTLVLGYDRDGEKAYLSGQYSVTADGTDASTFSMDLPAELTTSSWRGLTAFARVGSGFLQKEGATDVQLPVNIYYFSATNRLQFMPADSVHSAAGYVNGNSLGISSGKYSSIMITQATLYPGAWAGATQTFANNRVEYAYNSSGITDAGASDTSSFAYGIEGAEFGAINSTTTTGGSRTAMRVRFQNAIKPTDHIQLKFKGPDEDVLMNIGENIFIDSHHSENTATYGMGWNRVAGSDTDIDVYFGNAGRISSGATFGSAGSAWSGLVGYRWLVVKSSNPLGIGTGLATATQPGAVSRFQEWTDHPFNAGEYTPSGGGTWTVEVADYETYEYMIIGNMMTLNFKINSTTIASAGNVLRIPVPGGYTVQRGFISMSLFTEVSTTRLVGWIMGAVGGTTLNLIKQDATIWANSTNGTSVGGQVSFRINN